MSHRAKVQGALADCKHLAFGALLLGFGLGKELCIEVVVDSRIPEMRLLFL